MKFKIYSRNSLVTNTLYIFILAGAMYISFRAGMFYYQLKKIEVVYTKEEWYRIMPARQTVEKCVIQCTENWK